MCLTILETLDFFDNLGKWREKSGLSFGTFWESYFICTKVFFTKVDWFDILYVDCIYFLNTTLPFFFTFIYLIFTKVFV